MQRVLIANRGEIAVRIARACRVLGMTPIAVYSEADACARHVRAADLAVAIGPAPAAESYLCIENLLAAARKTGADAIHPGYGFLSENKAFAQAVEDAGLIWVGPPARCIAPIQSKTAAKQVAHAAGVPTAPARIVESDDPAHLAAIADEIGLPLLVKPQDGGGGKGMQVVRHVDEFTPAVVTARRIAKAAFASDRLFAEKLVERARHVEVQVLGDRHGDVRHVFERECSLQRRHQKVVEESPCAGLSQAERSAICQSGQAFAAQVGYQGAGTVEFLFDPVARKHYFLEMNTRLQVEHPVTEAVVGLDLCAAMLRIARGDRLADVIGEAPISQRGHAVEVRVYAEDPSQGYVPQAGDLARVIWPDAPFVRVDAGFQTGDTVPMHYDPLLAKVVAWGRTRAEAFDRLRAALGETVVHGVQTNLPMLLALCGHPNVRGDDLHTRWLDETYGEAAPGAGVEASEAALVALALGGPGGPLQTVTAAATAAAGPSFADPWATLGGLRVGGGR
jgi:acetyl/propionyl-CoA carboxylase alpha subunit